MKTFMESLNKDVENLVKEASELKEIFALSGREAYLADKEAMATLNQIEEENIEAELEAEYDGSREAAQDIYDRTEMDAINNN